jgi:hypothetical protein
MSDGIHTPFVNIDQLHKNQQDKLKKRYEIYEKILVRCHNKIKNTANHPDNMGFCFFEIPRYVYGTPLFDIKGCVVYMVNSLVKNGFDVRYTHPNLLFISWIGKTNQHSELQENVYQRAAIMPSNENNTSMTTSQPALHSSNSPTSYLQTSYTPTYNNHTHSNIQNNYNSHNSNYNTNSNYRNQTQSTYKPITEKESSQKQKAIEEIDKKILNIIKK